MKNANDVLSALKKELEFIDSGGYGAPVGSRQPLFCMETSTRWRPALIFEDSSICTKKKYAECNPNGDCTLMGLVPIGHRHETVPCRHIPLNEVGETLESLYKTGTKAEIETVLRNWLAKTINDLERQIRTAEPTCEKAA